MFQVDSYWLPLVRQVVPDDYRKPVILVGNKSDVLESSSMDVRLYVYMITDFVVDFQLSSILLLITYYLHKFYFCAQLVLHMLCYTLILERFWHWKHVFVAECVHCICLLFSGNNADHEPIC